MNGFKVMDHVYKPEGYVYRGYVVAVFENMAGVTRVVVENQDSPGMLHIFAPHQIERYDR